MADQDNARLHAQKLPDFQKFMADRKAQITKLLPKGTTYERFEMIAMIAIQKNRDLLLSDPMSLFQAFRDSAQVQLMPDGKEGVITTYKTKSGMLAKFSPMYQGLLRRALNDPAIRKIETNVVGEHDEFDWTEGTNPEVRLKRNLKGSGPLLAAYCLITLDNGEIMLEVMTQEQAHAVRDAKRGSDKGVWDSAFASEMWRKAVFRRAVKWAPISQATREALGDSEADIVDASYSDTSHPDNAKVTSEPPNPNAQVEHKPAVETHIADDTREVVEIEGELTEPVEQIEDARVQDQPTEDVGIAPGVLNPDAVLKELADELDMADTLEEVEVTVRAWRPRIGELMPPDIESAEEITERRRAKIRKAAK